MNKVKYILFQADFDECESDVYMLCTVEGISAFFDGDDEIVSELLSTGSYYGEWHQYHLIRLEDYL